MELDKILPFWDEYMLKATYVCIGISILIGIYHESRVILLKYYKQKYDYVNRYQVQFFWYSVLMLVFAFGFYTNTIATDRMALHGKIWFFVRLFITVSFTVIGYFGFYSLVNIYYPRYVEKRLQWLRDRPRKSPKGYRMRKLSEDEEDDYLTAEQIAEESSGVHAIDYDVWLDDITGYKKIEKYEIYLHAEQCPNCGFYTFKIIEEELIEKPTTESTGLFIKHYQCTYCKCREAKETKIAQLKKSSAA